MVVYQKNILSRSLALNNTPSSNEDIHLVPYGIIQATDKETVKQ